MMTDEFDSELGWMYDRQYFIYVEVTPSWNDPEKFVVTAFYIKTDPETLEEEKIEICRIDNKSHGFTHMDQEFKEGAPKKEMDVDVYEAWEIIENNWENSKLRRSFCIPENSPSFRQYARRHQNKKK